jgi:uncharacterized MAPEG superfamily protein
VLVKSANNNQFDNVNPRGAKASIQKSVPAEIFKTFERAEAAHKNSLENAPLFIGAVLAGNLAGVSPRMLFVVDSVMATSC